MLCGGLASAGHVVETSQLIGTQKRVWQVSWGIVAPASGERHGIPQAEMREIPRRAQAVADRVGGISVQMKIRTLLSLTIRTGPRYRSVGEAEELHDAGLKQMQFVLKTSDGDEAMTDARKHVF
jgi:hypothetical protein